MNSNPAVRQVLRDAVAKLEHRMVLLSAIAEQKRDELHSIEGDLAALASQSAQLAEALESAEAEHARDEADLLQQVRVEINRGIE